MPVPKITIRNIDQVRAAFKAAPAKAAQEFNTAVAKSILTIESNIKKESPVGQLHGGSLRQSIRSQMTGIASGKVEAAMFYAPYVEFGTRPHDIYAKNKKVLAARVGGVYKFFGSHVHHPGTKANPFFSRGIEASEGTIAVYFVDAIKKIFS